MEIDKWFSWRRITTAYAAVGAVVLLASALLWTPGGLDFAPALLGPVAWLFLAVPLFLMATIAFALSVLGAILLQGRSSAPGSWRYWFLPAVVWFALGAWALLVSV